MTDAKHLFNAVRAVKGSPLTQADVDAINAALGSYSARPENDPGTVIPTPAPDAITRLAIEHLNAEEGRVPSAYQDHLGYWTIGVGRLIDKRKGGQLSNPEIDMLLSNDIAAKRAQLAGWPSWERVKNDPVRAVAMLSMAFQMGAQGLAGFGNTLSMIAAGRFADAADNMLKSKWAQQTPARAKRVSEMMRTGRTA